jgi:O-antigen ligase
MKRYFDLIIINVLTLIIGILFYYITNQKVEILTAFLVTGISISLGIRQYKIENDKMFKELFTDLIPSMMKNSTIN